MHEIPRLIVCSKQKYEIFCDRRMRNLDCYGLRSSIFCRRTDPRFRSIILITSNCMKERVGGFFIHKAQLGSHTCIFRFDAPSCPFRHHKDDWQYKYPKVLQKLENLLNNTCKLPRFRLKLQKKRAEHRAIIQLVRYQLVSRLLPKAVQPSPELHSHSAMP